MLEFVIARNPEPDSSLPYLIRVPLGPSGVALKARDTWPRTAKIYCHRFDEWPAAQDLEIVERVPVRSCIRRGAAIDLVLDRGREARSQFVFTTARGREMIFWQTARTAKQARPSTQVPTRRAFGQVLEIVVDSHERYPWNFSRQQATTVRRALPFGDYGLMVDGELAAVVERKSLADLVATISGGKLRSVMAGLATVHRAAVVVEDRWSAVFGLDRIRPATVAEALAEAQVRFPTVPIVFCDSRTLAEEWTYRFFGAVAVHQGELRHGAEIERSLPAAGDVAPPEPTVAEVRRWAVGAGLEVPQRGRLRPEVWAAFRAARAVAPD